MDAMEATANAIVGLVVSWSATFFVLGYSPSESLAITAMFFGLSFIRSYLLRKVFKCLAS